MTAKQRKEHAEFVKKARENAARQREQAWRAAAAEDAAILAQVKLIIERDGQSRFQNIESPDLFVQNRLGFVKRNENRANEYIILPEQFKAEFAKGYGEKRVIQVLRDTGWLEIDAGGKSATRRTLPGMGQRRVYVLHLPFEN